MSEIKWHRSEHDDHPESCTAYLKGYVADVYPAYDNVSGWFWRVDNTAAISEYPETVDADFKPTSEEAKVEALRVLKKAAADLDNLIATVFGDSQER